ncbi:MAG: hypothetical protein K1X86_12505 [Ignavibacteria bacterium]|nr:hypothetical protein [Ignavibacteria bacterium]
MIKNFFKKFTPLGILTLLIVNYSLFISEAEAQWSLTSNTEDGKYTLVTNSSVFSGLSAGQVQGESVFALTSADTANWKFVSNTDNGLYSLVENKTSFMGIDPGKVRVKAVYLLNSSSSIDTTRLAFIDKSNSFVGRKQTFDTVNATVKYLLNGSDINTSGTLSNVAYLTQINNFSGKIGLGAGLQNYSRFVIGTDTVFNFVETTKNLDRTSYSQAIDSSSFNFRWINGKPLLQITGIEKTLYKIDTMGTEFISPSTLTGSMTNPAVDISQTWNTSGAPTALKLNITNTSSSTSSLLIDLQVGGVSMFSVRRDGRISTGTIVSQSDIVAGANNGISWSGRGGLASGSSSNVYAYGSGFSCFGIGGITSSYPGLSPSTNGSLKLMLADLSGYTKTIGGDFVHDDSSKGVVLKDSNGHYWRVTISNGGTLSTTDLGTSLTGF